MTVRALVFSLIVALPVLGVGPSPGVLRAGDAVPATHSVAQLNELVGPVALYPDVVLASLLPATTVPNDLAAASKYVGEQGGKVSAAPAGVTWDTSVLGLLPYPALLDWLKGNPDWVKQMGAAMRAQPSDVLAAIQTFRRTAEGAGNLTSNGQQTVSTHEVAGGTTEVIVIEPTNPEVVYVPVYSPASVTQPGYTGWAWGAGFVVGATTAAIYHNNNSVNWNSNGGNIYVNTGNVNVNTVNINTGNVNTGNINTGNVNTGNVNTGNVNTGNVNTGNVNTGNVNTGNKNSGNVNTGNVNTGNVNTGNKNSGNVNTGNANTGNKNAGNANAGGASAMGPSRGSQWQAPGAGAGSAQAPPAARAPAPPPNPASGFGGAGSGSDARAQSSRGASSLQQSGGGASGSGYRGQSGRSGGGGGGRRR